MARFSHWSGGKGKGIGVVTGEEELVEERVMAEEPAVVTALMAVAMAMW